MTGLKRIVMGFTAVACMCAPATRVHAQDTHYWNLHYGTRGELISGVMVGSALDLSSTFYNPGAFSRMENPSTLLTGTVFALQTITVVDADPTADSPQSSNTGPSPSMVAGLLPLKWFGGRMGYSFLTRQQLDFRLLAREGVVVGRDQPADTLSIGGETIFEQNMGEYWGGMTWSKNFGESFSLGTTLYGVYRSQRTRTQGLVQAFGSSGYSGAGTHVEEIDYWSARTLLKVGALWEISSLTVGVSATTPGLHLTGTGTAVTLDSATGDVDYDGTPDGAAQVSYVEDGDAEYRSPASLALGLSYRFDALTLHATSEVFGSLDPYTVLDSPAPATGPGVTGIEVRYQHAAESVWNTGIGVEYRFTDKSTFYAAFITDRSSFRKVEGASVTVSDWDLYHLSGGFALTLGGTELTLGMGYAWGSEELTPVTEQTGDLPPNVVPDEAKYRRMKFIIGIAL